MDLSLGQPLGLLALLGVPLVLFFHLLRRRPTRRKISTLFMVDAVGLPSVEGRVIDRLVSSVPLWLQLLGVLFATWLLIDPRFQRPGQVRRAVWVLDDTASMQAFLPEAKAAIGTKGEGIDEWVVISSSPDQAVRFRGKDRGALIATLAQWRPREPSHDPGPQLELAARMKGPDGVALFLTDRPAAVPPGVAVVAVGRPIENVGFLGVEVGDDRGVTRFRATLRNHGANAQTRSWRLHGHPPTTIELDAGEVRTIEGALDEDVSTGTLELDEDAFPLDDTLPFLLPEPKPLGVINEAAKVPGVEALIRAERLVVGEPGLTISQGAAAGPAIRFVAAKAASPKVFGGVYAERDPLTKGLSFSGLLVPDGASRLGPGERAILWRGDRPIVRTGPGPQLIVDFDLSTSNADQVPAWALLVHRFVEEVRAATLAPEKLNVELGQRLGITTRQSSLSLVGPEGGKELAPAALHAPLLPGFFTVSEGGQLRASGAAHFGDVAEADFRAAATVDLSVAPLAAVESAARGPDPYAQLWALVWLGLMLGSWAYSGRRR